MSQEGVNMKFELMDNSGNAVIKVIGVGGGGNSYSGYGGDGAVRLIWPGDARQFPSTRTADEY